MVHSSRSSSSAIDAGMKTNKTEQNQICQPNMDGDKTTKVTMHAI